MRIYTHEGLPKQQVHQDVTLAAGTAEEMAPDDGLLADLQPIGYQQDDDGIALLRAVGATQDDDGIAVAQPPTDTVSLVLEPVAAALVPPRQITFTSADDLSAVTFTIVGTNEAGDADTEDVAGPNAETVTSSKAWSEITSITPAGTAAEDVEVGWPDTVRQLDLESVADDLLPARPLTLTSLDDLSAITFIVQGQDHTGADVSEGVAGPNAGTTQSTNLWARIYAILPDTADDGEVEAGWPNSSDPLPLRLNAAALNIDPERFVTITSGADVSSINFTINGSDAEGNPLTETIAGPNADTVQTMLRFKTVSAILPDDDLDESVSAGVAADVVEIFRTASGARISMIILSNPESVSSTVHVRLYLRVGTADVLCQSWELGSLEGTHFPELPVPLGLGAGDRLFLHVDAPLNYSIHGYEV